MSNQKTSPLFSLESIRPPEYHFGGFASPAALRSELFVFLGLQRCDLMSELNAGRAHARQDLAPNLRRKRLRRKHSRLLAREIFDEERRHMRGGIGNGCGEKSPPADLVQRRESAIAAEQQALVVFGTVLFPLHEHGEGEARVLQHSLADQFGL